MMNIPIRAATHPVAGSSTTSGRPNGLDEILRRPLTELDRGLPFPPSGATISDVGDIGWALEDLLPPVAVLRESALANNLQVMADYCSDRGFELAPHAKTTMAPQLVARQLDHGAWAMTVGTVFQARVLAHFGVRRIVIAHQICDPVGLREIGRLLVEHPDLDLYALADSRSGVEAMHHALSGLDASSHLNVLVELGMPGGRTGCRSLEELIDVARAVGRASSLRLAGVEGYEGLADRAELEDALVAVDAFLDRLVDASEALRRDQLIESRMILSAGGSAYFDRVVDRFARADPDILRVLRSGCYVTHDHGKYRRLSPLDGRAQAGPYLLPALEVWAAAVSRPEPDLLIVNAGRRDMSFDAGMPVAVKRTQVGAQMVENLDEWWPVERIMDQHAMLRIPTSADVGPGDLIGLGISHPCTTFDKWRLLPVVDDGYHMVDAVVTVF